MATKTKEVIQQQIENEKKRLEKLKKELKAKEKAEAEISRKKRNHRLIRIGGIIEQYAGEIKNLDAFEAYVRQYAHSIKKNQQQANTFPEEKTQDIGNH